MTSSAGVAFRSMDCPSQRRQVDGRRTDSFTDATTLIPAVLKFQPRDRGCQRVHAAKVQQNYRIQPLKADVKRE